MPTHDRFDLPRWIREFDLAPLEAEARRWGALDAAARDKDAGADRIGRAIRTGGVCGPQDLAGIEQIRAGFGGAGALGQGVPADVFVWALGEPAKGAATKIGGVPHRPASAPWPTGRNGRALHLLAQICFADSHDLVSVPRGFLSKSRPLPGDVLLIFAPGDYLVDWDDDEQDSLTFEWQPLAIPDLVTPAGVPAAHVSPLTPMHAQVHRTADFPRPPDGHAIYDLYFGKSVGLIGGTKIGGLPAWGQSDPGLPGRHLCTIGSVNPGIERYPLLNHEGGDPKGTFLMMADLGQLYLSIDKNARIHWTVQGG